jgi:hypothetical protein
MQNDYNSKYRLTKKQSVTLFLIALSISLIGRNYHTDTDNLLLTLIIAVNEVVMIYAFISLCTKKGLRWR